MTELNDMKSKFDVNLKEKKSEFDQTKAKLIQVNQQLETNDREVMHIELKSAKETIETAKKKSELNLINSEN